MHIVYISREFIPSERAGGIASYLYTVVHAIASKGHNVTVVCASDNTRTCSDSMDKDVRIIRLQGGDFFLPQAEKGISLKKLRFAYRYHSYRRRVAATIAQIHKENKIDIIESADFGDEDIFIDRKLNIPLVIRLHTPVSSSEPATLKYKLLSLLQAKKLLRERLENTGYITACSEYIKSQAISYFQLNPDKIKTIHNPVESSVPSVLSLSAQPIKKGGIINICYAGTICQAKGVKELIEACELLRANGLNIHLTLAGKMGTWGLQQKQLASQKTWCDFIGMLPHKEVFKLYMESDIACFPSWAEPFGIVCIEAMLTGTITIGSTSGGMSEIIKDGKDGFLVKPKNSELLARTIEKAIHISEQERTTMSALAKEKIITKFSTDVIAKQMLEYYNQVILNYKSI